MNKADQPKKNPKNVHPNLAQLQQEITDLTEALRHERADAINIRRRSEEEKEKMGTFYKAIVLRQLLPVLDNLKRAIDHKPKDLVSNQWAQGVDAINSQLEKSLSDLGVEKIKTVGEAFDPKFHEAVAVEEGEGTKEVVSEELQAGYKIDDEVVRHAVVKVKIK